MDCDVDNNTSDLKLGHHILKGLKTTNKKIESLFKEMGPTNLIEAVEKRPAIWNRSICDYRSKDKKLLWMEIIEELFPHLAAEMDSVDKDYVAYFLNTKWKNVRDSYIRCLRSNIEDPNNRKSYIYETQLKFLDNLYFDFPENPSPELETPGHVSLASIQNDFELIEEEELPNRSSGQPMKLGFTSGLDANNRNRTRVLRANDPSCDDIDFFRSLLPITKPLPMNLKMQFRMDILELALRYYEHPEMKMSRLTGMPPYTKPQAPVMETFHHFQYPPLVQQFYDPIPPVHHLQQSFFNPNQGQHIFGNGLIRQPMQMPINLARTPVSQELCNRPKQTNVPKYR